MPVATDAKGEAVVRFTLPDRIESGDGLLTVLVPDGGVTESISRRVPIVISGLKMAFYPEGGDLVAGLRSRVYFEAQDASGKSADVEGRIVDDLGREHAVFRSFASRSTIPRRPSYPWPSASCSATAWSAFAMDLLMGTRGYRRFDWVPVVESWAFERERERAARERQASEAASKAAAGDGSIAAGGRTGSYATGHGEVAKRAPREDARFRAEEAAAAGLRESRHPAPPPVAAPAAPEPNAALAPETVGVLGALRDAQVNRGQGFGGGGTAEGLGGLRTKGRGAGGGAGGFAGQARAGEPIILGALDKSLIEAVIQRHGKQFSYCYAKELTRAGTGQRGKILVKFNIDAEGRVSSAAVTSSTMKNKAVERCVVERIRRMQFPAPRGGGQVTVTYPFVFTEAGAPPTPRVSWAPVRVFPVPSLSPGALAEGVARTDFRDTIYWNPSVRTGETGRARVSFPLSDAITSFRASAEGVGRGLVGRGEIAFPSVLPFSMIAKLPLEVSAGDRFSVPITFTNEGERGLQVQPSVEVGEGLSPISQLPEALSLAAHARQSLFLELAVTGQEGKVPLRLSASADGLEDAWRREITLVPLGFPAEWSGSGHLAEQAIHSLQIDDLIEGTLHASLEVFPNPVTTLVSGLEGMLSLPRGCFEQASSTNYPNVMVLRHLQRAGTADQALQEKTRTLLVEGYKRLTSYEARSGGYEWFGADPGHEALTAYGLLQFKDMKGVYEGVDADVLSRASSWLSGKKNEDGGFKRNPKALDSFGRASEALTEAYITWALVEAGLSAGFEAQIDKQARLAATEGDPYVLALTANTLLALPDRRSEGHSAVGRLAAMQHAEGSWKGAAESITRSSGANLEVETSALALLSLMKDGTNPAAIERGVGWLHASRGGSGRWGSTQATILALRALDEYATRYAATEKPGSIEVRVNGLVVGTLKHDPDTKGKLRLEGLERWIGVGRNEIALAHRGERPIPYTLAASYRSRKPVSDPTTAVGLITRLTRQELPMGETVRLDVEVRNVTDKGQPMSLARVGIPGGLSLQSWQLDDLEDRGAFDFYETRAREVILYWRSLAPRAEHHVGLDLVAEVPGTWTGPASSAYLYYTDDAVAWVEPLRVVVTR